MIDLTAHRTMGLRDAVQADVNVALTVVVHALALQVFYPAWGTWTPLQLRLSVTGLERLAPGVSDGPAGRRVADRLEAWGARLPEEARDLWAVLAPMAPSDLLDLMACCAGVGLYAVRDPHPLHRLGGRARAEGRRLSAVLAVKRASGRRRRRPGDGEERSAQASSSRRRARRIRSGG